MTSLGKLICGDIHHRFNMIQDEKYIDSLSLAYENIFCMPFDMTEKYGDSLNTLDISHNRFSRSLQFLSEFENLTSLNLDYNNIDEYTVLPYMPKLELLWLNHNSIDDLHPFVKNLQESVPNLKYLCLMGNKAAPSFLNGGNFHDNLQYRLYVISWFPHLVHLDDKKVTLEQQKEANRLYKRPLLEDFVKHTPECLKQLHNKITNIFSKTGKERISDITNIIV